MYWFPGFGGMVEVGEAVACTFVRAKLEANGRCSRRGSIEEVREVVFFACYEGEVIGIGKYGDGDIVVFG